MTQTNRFALAALFALLALAPLLNGCAGEAACIALEASHHHCD